MPAWRLLDISGAKAEGGFCSKAMMPEEAPWGDTIENPKNSSLRLFEEGREIGAPHSTHDDIKAQGGGRFSHWRNELYFSATDNSPAHENGRRYTVLFTPEPRASVHHAMMPFDELNESLVGTDEGYRLAERLLYALVPGVHLGQAHRSHFKDTEFAADYELFEPNNYRSFDRKYLLREFARLAARMPGDMAECGVYEGGSSWLMAKALIEAKRTDASLHLFDSFAGLSQPGATDGSYWEAGAMAVPLSRVRANLASVESVMQYWPGWIPYEFHAVRDRQFSLVHIDVDLAQPTWDSLEFFYPRLVDRGFIICDDYGFDTCPGARAAVDAYCAEQGVRVLHLPTGQGLIIRAAH